MKNRKLKSGVSYDKVITLLKQTDDFKMLKHRVMDRLNAHHFAGWHVETDYSGNPYANGQVKFADGFGFSVRPSTSTNNGAVSYYAYFSRSDFVKKDELLKVIQDNFGVTKPGQKKPAVPTYFCNGDRVLEMMWESDNLFDESDKTLEIRTHYSGFLTSLVGTDEYRAGLNAKRAEYIVEDIKKCLLRHKDATPEIIKQALDMYLIHEVMMN
jgi:hypothetical protein